MTGTPAACSSRPKNDGAHLALAQQLQDHSLYREYEAVVLGNLREDQGTISLPIARHPTDRKKMAVNHSSGRPAVTHWTVLARYPGYTHVQCRLETGRTHQIRSTWRPRAIRCWGTGVQRPAEGVP